MIASMFWALTPIWILLVLLVVLLLFSLLARIKGGRYVRPIMNGLMKVPLLKRGLRKMSDAAIERRNPALASAIRKMERSGAMRDPQRMQKLLSSLSAAERRAWLEAAGEQQQDADVDMSNRQLRRQMERQGLGPAARTKSKAKAKGKGRRKRGR